MDMAYRIAHYVSYSGRACLFRCYRKFTAGSTIFAADICTFLRNNQFSLSNAFSDSAYSRIGAVGCRHAPHGSGKAVRVRRTTGIGGCHCARSLSGKSTGQV